MLMEAIDFVECKKLFLPLYWELLDKILTK